MRTIEHKYRAVLICPVDWSGKIVFYLQLNFLHNTLQSLLKLGFVMFFISSQMPLAQVCPKIYLSSKLHPGAKLKLHLEEQHWLLVFHSFQALRGNEVISSANMTQPTSTLVMRLSNEYTSGFHL